MLLSSQPMRIFAVTGHLPGGGPDHRERDAFQQRAIAQQRTATVLADHFVDRAAEVQVDEIRLHPVDHRARGFRQAGGFTTEKLDAQRTFQRVVERNVFLRAFVAVQDAIGGDEFGREHIRALLLAKLAEDRNPSPPPSGRGTAGNRWRAEVMANDGS